MKNLSTALLTAVLFSTLGFAAEAAPGVVKTVVTAKPTILDTTKVKQSIRISFSSENDSNGKHKYVNITNGRSESLSYKGDIKLTRDFTAIESISPNGFFEYSLSVNGDKKQLKLTSDAQGRLTHKYSINGKETAFAPAGAAWLQQVMPNLMAKSGIGLEDKVQDLYQKKGAKGVLAEADKVEGEHGKLKMVSQLLEQPGLNTSDLQLALQHAGQNSSSDYELSKLLRNVSASHLSKPEVSDAYLKATQNISSDHEKGKVLARLLQVPNMSKQSSDNTLKAIGTMSSDYEKGQLVQQASSNKDIIRNSYQTTFSLIDDFSSDYERSKAIQYIVKQHKLSATQYQALLPVVRDIASDYEKGKVLRSIAAKIPADADAVREDYKQTAKTIGSDYEYRKVIEALQ